MGKRPKKKTRVDRDKYYVFMSRADGALEQGYRVQLLPAVFFTCCVLLISRMIQGPSAYAGFDGLFYMGDLQITSDFFFYYKSIAVYICAVIALVFIGYRAMTSALWVRKSRLYIPLAAFLLLVFLSFVFSTYRRIAWLGTDGLYSGAAVILCCGFMFFYILNSVSDERGVKWFIRPLTVCLAVASAIGITQASGNDFFRTVLGQKLLVPNIETATGETAWELIDSFAAEGRTAIDFTFDTAVYQTVGNPNYVALYTPLVLPLFAFLFLRERETGSLIRRIVWAAMFGLILFNLFASQSIGGVVGAAAALAACAVLSGRGLFENMKPKLALIAIVIVCAALNFQTLAGGVAKNIVESVGADNVPAGVGEMAEGQVDVSDLDDLKRPPYSVHRIERIVTKTDRVEVTIDGDSFALTDDPASLNAAMTYGTAALIPQPDGGTTITLQLAKENRVWQFVQTADGYKFINDMGKPVSLREVDRVGNDELLYLGTGRVYIWSRTVPLLKDTILLGRGPDTFMLYFPQDDYVGRYNGSWDLRAVIDKPHNMYLNIAFGSGIISLAAFIAIIGLFLAQGFRLYRRRAEAEENDVVPALTGTVGRGILAGVCGFLAAGMFYDAVTPIMPLFWGLLALGAACNYIGETKKGI